MSGLKKRRLSFTEDFIALRPGVLIVRPQDLSRLGAITELEVRPSGLLVIHEFLSIVVPYLQLEDFFQAKRL